jgi:hypothetical protein
MTNFVAGNTTKYSREFLLELALSPLSQKEPKDWEHIVSYAITKKVYSSM